MWDRRGLGSSVSLIPSCLWHRTSTKEQEDLRGQNWSCRGSMRPQCQPMPGFPPSCPVVLMQQACCLGPCLTAASVQHPWHQAAASLLRVEAQEVVGQGSRCACFLSALATLCCLLCLAGGTLCLQNLLLHSSTVWPAKSCAPCCGLQARVCPGCVHQVAEKGQCKRQLGTIPGPEWLAGLSGIIWKTAGPGRGQVDRQPSPFQIPEGNICQLHIKPPTNWSKEVGASLCGGCGPMWAPSPCIPGQGPGQDTCLGEGPKPGVELCRAACSPAWGRQSGGSTW